jgi:hypothetical protein
MTSRREDDAWTPSPEQLAAYADGELEQAGPGACQPDRIEKWLAEHPEQAAEVEAQRRLAGLWRNTAAADPGEDAWAALWSRVQAAPPEAGEQPARPGRRFAWSLAVVVAAAAVLLAFILLPGEEDGPAPGPEAEPFPVASAADVDIIRMDGADLGTLVVGRLPVDGLLPVARADEVEIMGMDGADTYAVVVGELPVVGPLVLAAPGEVALKRADPEDDLRMGQQDTPMLWAP